MLMICCPFILEGSLLLLAIGFLYATLRLPPAPIPKSKPDVEPRSFGKNDINYDIVGGVFMILALAMPLLALNMAGGIVPWSHPAVIVLLSLTPVLIAALFYIEGYLAKSPIFPTRFFTSVPVLLVNLCTIALIFSWNQVFLTTPSLLCALTHLSQIMFNLSFYAQIRDIYGNTFQNWVLTCVFVGQPIGSFSTGLFIQKTKAVKAALAASILLSCLLYTGLAAGWISEIF